jgi:lipase chaperone LimK
MLAWILDKKALLAALLLAAIVLGRFLLPDNDVPPGPQAGVAEIPTDASPGRSAWGAQDSATHANAAAVAPALNRPAQPDLQPAFLDGIRVDHFGGLALDHELRASLDALLEHLPADADAAQIAALREAILDSQLPFAAAGELADLMESYHTYRRTLDELQAEADAPESLHALEEQLELLAQLRRRHFDDATADALFGREEAHTRYTLAALAVESDPRLTPEKRVARLRELQRELPPELAAIETGDPQLAALERQIDELRAAGASEAQVRALRLRQLDAEAAEQMREMASIEDEWETRYRAYSREKELIVAASLDEADKQTQIEDLLQQHYEAHELAAARNYDRERSAPRR